MNVYIVNVLGFFGGGHGKNSAIGSNLTLNRDGETDRGREEKNLAGPHS